LSQGAGIIPLDFAVSPDSQTLLAGYGDGSMRLYQLADGRFLHQFAPQNPRDRYGVHGVAYSPDGRRIAAAQGLSTLRVYDVATAKELMQTKARDKTAFISIAFSPDGDFIFAGSRNGSPKSGAAMFDAKTGNLVREFVSHKEPVVWVRVSPDGTRLATVTRGGWGRLVGNAKQSDPAEVSVWDVASGSLLRRLDAHSDRLAGAAFLTGHNLAVAGDETIHLWNVDTGLEKIIEEHDAPIVAVSASPDSKTFVTASSDGVAVCLDSAGSIVERLVAPGTSRMHVVFLPDGMPASIGESDGIATLVPFGP
jgi:WD40 repeat protein